MTGTTAPVSGEIDSDPARLRAYLADGRPELEGEIRVERVGGGPSNPTEYSTASGSGPRPAPPMPPPPAAWPTSTSTVPSDGSTKWVDPLGRRGWNIGPDHSVR